jgi:hypothetical protein
LSLLLLSQKMGQRAFIGSVGITGVHNSLSSICSILFLDWAVAHNSAFHNSASITPPPRPLIKDRPLLPNKDSLLSWWYHLSRTGPQTSRLKSAQQHKTCDRKGAASGLILYFSHNIVRCPSQARQTYHLVVKSLHINCLV